MRTVPAPSMIGFSSVKTRPIIASARLLRNGLLLLTPELLRATRRHTGTAAAANTANINSCNCHDSRNTNDNSPTKSAASPIQNRNTPGNISSRPISSRPNTSQFQVPSVENISAIVDLLLHCRRREGGDPYALLSLLDDAAEAFLNSGARGYGSPPSRGRRGDWP